MLDAIQPLAVRAILREAAEYRSLSDKDIAIKRADIDPQFGHPRKSAVDLLQRSFEFEYDPATVLADFSATDVRDDVELLSKLVYDRSLNQVGLESECDSSKWH